jgi:hypothetical protein
VSLDDDGTASERVRTLFVNAARTHRFLSWLMAASQAGASLHGVISPNTPEAFFRCAYAVNDFAFYA